MYWDERGFNPGWRLGSQWEVTRLRGAQKRARVEGGAGTGIQLGASGRKRVLVARIKLRGFIPKNTLKYVGMVVPIALKVWDCVV